MGGFEGPQTNQLLDGKRCSWIRTGGEFSEGDRRGSGWVFRSLKMLVGEGDEWKKRQSLEHGGIEGRKNPNRMSYFPWKKRSFGMVSSSEILKVQSQIAEKVWKCSLSPFESNLMNLYFSSTSGFMGNRILLRVFLNFICSIFCLIIACFVLISGLGSHLLVFREYSWKCLREHIYLVPGTQLGLAVSRKMLFAWCFLILWELQSVLTDFFLGNLCPDKAWGLILCTENWTQDFTWVMNVEEKGR